MAVSHCTDTGSIVGHINQIHWSCNLAWISLWDIDTCEWRPARLDHVVGRLEKYDSAPRPMREPEQPLPDFSAVPVVEVAHAC